MADRGERLGRVEVEMPPGRPMRPDEADLVERLLAQSSLAVRNLRLETDLANQVTELGRRTAALEESRRRLVLARDAEKARFTAALQETVLPHLEPLPERLLTVAGATDAGGCQVDLEAERGAATAALDELRRLVRGTRSPARHEPAGQQAAGQEAAEDAEDQPASSRSGPNADLVT